MLDIVVTHYNEPWTVGQKFFDMLGCQRGINFADIRVILVHDGTKQFPAKFFGNYPYAVVQHTIPHGGVSAARNAGLAMATEKWIQFCDFDDMYTNAYALKQVMSVMDRDADYMWTPFFMEYKRDGELQAKVNGEENVIFVHGKYFRREWLIENNLRFPEGIHYSEDSAFCAIVNELAKLNRRGKIKTDFPVYTWTYRVDSVSMNPENEVRNLTGFIERNFYVVEEFKRRGIPHTLMVGRMFADAYHAFHRADRKFPEQEAEFIRRARPYLPDLNKVNDENINKVLQAAGIEFRNRKMDYSETFWEWIDEKVA